MKYKIHKICSDCEHYAACASWNIGSIYSMDATHCVNFKKVVTSHFDVPEKNVREWISVKDRLPEKNTPVLWYVVLKERGMGHCRLGTFDGAINHEVPSVSCCGPNAIPKFWMQLPEPPKEET